MRKNRGKEGSDIRLFGTAAMQQKIAAATIDLSYLLERGYGIRAACELVGNRYRLNIRQQQALKGMSTAASKVNARKQKQQTKDSLQGQTIFIDAFNVIILMESLLSEAFLFKGMDGCYRDLSSIHGTYKRVNQTEKAIAMLTHFFKEQQVAKVIWVFDKPVSNSGRMKDYVLELGEQNNIAFDAVLENNADKYLIQVEDIVISSDAWILDECNQWFNLLEVFVPKGYQYLVKAR